ncbi:hypothetical protein QQ008_01085 [Fulvivirgaceae bacterium BMA10]|uniref:Uncharacterized protein n=2 Tax=Splendidivirga corallicola TaxID=3051826 RepID=A0ABT8KGU6_9BACT|nr:hypothetical protein [Fulvivirgaceae bacterium BMA10]
MFKTNLHHDWQQELQVKINSKRAKIREVFYASNLFSFDEEAFNYLSLKDQQKVICLRQELINLESQWKTSESKSVPREKVLQVVSKVG